ncbi:hypothetical protein [Desulfovibrio intestinalis]|uniref:Uncharacterized protein n=1 Tax=Desulfovibrio intestinalis TaxID=58621 RepID=A0A7W8C309_9BACT|nr:hypothetical protein [Desulfovibrio intestinalis]MBB5143938.1 hypothetical protein [Desulfovibrio intestinalis]
MTLVSAWYSRSEQVSNSLMIASDSCLSYGERWTCCPKIFPLNRNDSAICFAGSTFFAFPIILQVINMINMHEKIMSRAEDICDLQSFIIDLLNSMMEKRSFFSTNGKQDPDVRFLFAGYSWKHSAFYAWIYEYKDDKFSKRLVIDSSVRSSKRFAFIGDVDREVTTEDIPREAQIDLLKRLKKAGKKPKEMTMEPFDVIRSYINNKEKTTIAGKIQFVKINRHMNVQPFNIISVVDGKQEMSLFGRDLLAHEKNRYLALHEETKDVYSYPFSEKKLLYNASLGIEK